jgi:hypothetical protein
MVNGKIVASGEIRDYQTAMSEALLALRRVAASHDGRRPIRPLLDTTLKNAMEDMRLREKRRRQRVSVDAEPVDEEDEHTTGVNPDDLRGGDREKGVPCQQAGEYRERFLRPRTRFRGGWSSVLWEVIRREAEEAFKTGVRQGMRACGMSEEEIDAAIRREKRTRRQRRLRQRQRAGAAK